MEGIGTTNFGRKSQCLIINVIQFIVNIRNSKERSTSAPRKINGQDQTIPEHVTIASVSLSALSKAKFCPRNSKNICWQNCYWYRIIKAWYRYPYFWYQVLLPLQNVVPGTTPLKPWCHYPVTTLLPTVSETLAMKHYKQLTLKMQYTRSIYQEQHCLSIRRTFKHWRKGWWNLSGCSIKSPFVN